MTSLPTRWSSSARRDILRLHDFLKRVNPYAAKRIVSSINDAVKNLPQFPQIGHGLDGFEPQDVRALIVDDYEVRYEITSLEIIIVRIWHTREDR